MEGVGTFEGLVDRPGGFCGSDLALLGDLVAREGKDGVEAVVFLKGTLISEGDIAIARR